MDDALEQAAMLAALKLYGSLQEGSRFSYMTVHPLADAVTHLQVLGMTPDACTLVDLYWAWRSAIYFVSISGDRERDARAVYNPRERRKAGGFLSSPTFCRFHR
jgi:hypothetical protein